MQQGVDVSCGYGERGREGVKDEVGEVGGDCKSRVLYGKGGYGLIYVYICIILVI